jgi:transcriptional regulator of acetoin/glycerol metabolism
MELLLAYRWPGNVRELQNTIEAAVALARGSKLRIADLARLREPDGAHHPLPRGIELSLSAYERACLEEALQRAQGCVRQAAVLLGIGRSTLYRKLSEHGLTR